MYAVIFSDLAKKQFFKLPKEIQERVISALRRIRVRPEAYVAKLVSDSGFKLRVGDYRLIMDMQMDKLTIFFIKLCHKKNIYY